MTYFTRKYWFYDHHTGACLMLLFMEQELKIANTTIHNVEKVELEASRDISVATLKVRLHVKNNDELRSFLRDGVCQVSCRVP